MGSYISKGVGGVMENMKEQQQTMKCPDGIRQSETIKGYFWLAHADQLKPICLTPDDFTKNFDYTGEGIFYFKFIHLVQMERQIILQNEMRQRGMATQIAFAREMFMWWGSFYAFVSVGTLMGFLKTKKPALLVPIIPLTFIVGYQADFAYGSKITRVQAEAENILQNEGSLLNLPLGRPTIALIDEKRKN